MQLKQQLPVTYLLFTFRGRIPRLVYWTVSLFIWSTFYILFTALKTLFGVGATWIIYPLLFWSIIATSSKRFHDLGKSGKWLWAVLLPVIGPLWVVFQLGFRRGTKSANEFGAVPGSEIDYFKNPEAEEIPHLGTTERIVNDITRLNPVVVKQVIKPTSMDEVREILANTTGPVSVGGGRFSMGGQTASRQSIHLDMMGMNQIIDFSKEQKLIKVQAGIRWCDIQRHIDPHDLSVKIMQTYANFTVGGSLSVNVHGRYVGLGPLILSVRSIDIVLANGTLVRSTKEENPEIFFGAIGGYNGLGVIVHAELELTDNVAVNRKHKKMPISQYPDYFVENIRENVSSIFHNADMYPPKFDKVRAVTWEKTTEAPTVKTRLMPLRESYPLERYFMWAFTETPFGKWRREHIIEPLVFLRKKVHWRNYEAGYDVAELEPRSREQRTYVLQEYFVPLKRFYEFVTKMTEIYTRHEVNVLNISVRHSKADPGSCLAWAKEECFAFVVYYKQRTRENAKNRVAVWTRELIDAALSVNGSYYLPYQAHATAEQFHLAYPHAVKLFQLKNQLDPEFRFRNVIWDTYYQAPKEEQTMKSSTSEFKAVFSEVTKRDRFYKFLQVIFHLYPEDRFHNLILQACEQKQSNEEIYKLVQSRLPEIKPFLSELTYALPALRKQKKEMAKETLQLLGDKKEINGYVEIGSTGRYISELRKHLTVKGDIFLINDVAPDNSLAEIMERGQLRVLGYFIDLEDYPPIGNQHIPDNSIDVVTCYIGLHHAPVEKLDGFVKSIHRVLRTGGAFIMRDHDVKTKDMATFVSLVHTVFNLGLNVSWEKNHGEFKRFKSIDEWSLYLGKFGFTDTGKRILQDLDPSDNTLVLFTKN